MKGNRDILRVLVEHLTQEVYSVSQTMVHAEIAANWGFLRLHSAIKQQAHDDMRHVKQLIERILFLEGKPFVGAEKLILGEDVPSIIEYGLQDELEAVQNYNSSIKLAFEHGDNGTRAVLMSILKDKEQHVEWGETQQELLTRMGLEPYLTSLV